MKLLLISSEDLSDPYPTSDPSEDPPDPIPTSDFLKDLSDPNSGIIFDPIPLI
jgi:hypothetical protein